MTASQDEDEALHDFPHGDWPQGISAVNREYSPSDSGRPAFCPQRYQKSCAADRISYRLHPRQRAARLGARGWRRILRAAFRARQCLPGCPAAALRPTFCRQKCVTARKPAVFASTFVRRAIRRIRSAPCRRCRPLSALPDTPGSPAAARSDRSPPPKYREAPRNRSTPDRPAWPWPAS